MLVSFLCLFCVWKQKLDLFFFLMGSELQCWGGFPGSPGKSGCQRHWECPGCWGWCRWQRCGQYFSWFSWKLRGLSQPSQRREGRNYRGDRFVSQKGGFASHLVIRHLLKTQAVLLSPVHCGVWRECSESRWIPSKTSRVVLLSCFRAAFRPNSPETPANMRMLKHRPASRSGACFLPGHGAVEVANHGGSSTSTRVGQVTRYKLTLVDFFSQGTCRKNMS